MAPPYTRKTTVHELASDYAPIIQGKIILTTGVTPGSLGAVFVEAIAASNPTLLILAGRNALTLQQTANTITSQHPNVKTRTLTLDLSSMNAVRKAAEEVNSWADVPRIDVLVNNAAVMAVDYKLTEEGFEMQFATGHLGHFLFTNLVMGKLLTASAPRVLTLWKDGETYQKWYAYGQVKTANMLFALSLAEKLGKRGLQSYSLHPGAILNTGLAGHLDASENGDFKLLVDTDRKQGNAEGWKGMDFVSPEVGAATHAFAAFEPCISDQNGAYLLQCRIADPYVDTVKPWATSPIEAEKLWRLSEKLVGQEFKYQ
ncbi:hypothetical protein IL306_007210 [Fusarium sp. DS 682]|nr:hypothetical protein IL306_007210 [Fusarium sp. DS 682]